MLNSIMERSNIELYRKHRCMVIDHVITTTSRLHVFGKLIKQLMYRTVVVTAPMCLQRILDMLRRRARLRRQRRAPQQKRCV